MVTGAQELPRERVRHRLKAQGQGLWPRRCPIGVGVLEGPPRPPGGCQILALAGPPLPMARGCLVKEPPSSRFCAEQAQLVKDYEM